MNGRELQAYRLHGREIRVLEHDDCWHVGSGEQEVTKRYLDHALAELLNLPSHVALKLALAILNASPGSDLAL